MLDGLNKVQTLNRHLILDQIATLDRYDMQIISTIVKYDENI